MEWQNEQIRFFSNSGVFGVGGNGNYQGGVLMTQQMMWCLIVPLSFWAWAKAINELYDFYQQLKWDKQDSDFYDDENQS